MGYPAEELSREQVVLRRWLSSDVPALVRAVTESMEHLRPWMPWAVGYSRRAAVDFLRASEREWVAGEAYNYAITTGGVVVGGCGLMRRIGPGGLEIGYWLHVAWTGRGLATMAAAALRDEALGLPGVNRVEIHHDPANQASAAVPRRLGMTRVGRLSVPKDPGVSEPPETKVIWRTTR